MSIEIANEHLVPIVEVPRRLPRKASGRPVHISTVYRWLTRGVRGVVLESVKIGGASYTSVEAIQRFADRLKEMEPGRPTITPSLNLTRQKQIEAATRKVEDILGTGGARGTLS